MILSSASRRSQHYSPAGSAKGKDGSSPGLRSQPTAQPLPAVNCRVSRIPPRIPAGSRAVCTARVPLPHSQLCQPYRAATPSI